MIKQQKLDDIKPVTEFQEIDARFQKLREFKQNQLAKSWRAIEDQNAKILNRLMQAESCYKI